MNQLILKTNDGEAQSYDMGVAGGPRKMSSKPGPKAVITIRLQATRLQGMTRPEKARECDNGRWGERKRKAAGRWRAGPSTHLKVSQATCENVALLPPALAKLPSTK